MIQQWIKRTSRGMERSRLMQQNKGAVSPRWSKLPFLFTIYSPSFYLFSFFLYFFINGMKHKQSTRVYNLSHWIFPAPLKSPEFSWIDKSGNIWFVFMCLICVLSCSASSVPRGCERTTCLVWVSLVGCDLNKFIKSLQIRVADVQRACPFLFWIPGYALGQCFMFKVVP